MQGQTNTSDRPLLSIIIPALNEERRLPASLVKIDEFLSKQSYKAEVVVVENGSTDDTVGVVTRFAATHPYVRLFAGEPRGKGRAVKRGMLEATGEYRFICDSDLSMPIEEVAGKCLLAKGTFVLRAGAKHCTPSSCLSRRATSQTFR